MKHWHSSILQSVVILLFPLKETATNHLSRQLSLGTNPAVPSRRSCPDGTELFYKQGWLIWVKVGISTTPVGFNNQYSGPMECEREWSRHPAPHVVSSSQGSLEYEEQRRNIRLVFGVTGDITGRTVFCSINSSVPTPEFV